MRHYCEFHSNQVDPTLSFLDEFVADALSKGAAPYIPKQYREKEQEKQASNGKCFTYAFFSESC